jgi:cardiolipin synthase A/B
MTRGLALFLAPLAFAACRASGNDTGDDTTADADTVAADAAPPTVDAPPLVDYCNATDPRPTPIEVAATPEAGEAPYVTVLEGAHTSIDLSVYLMGYGGILDALEAKARAGIPVRVILDEYKRSTNQQYFDRLTAAGAEVHWSDPAFSYFHAKYFIVDGEVAVISTGNYSKNYSIELERNFVATDRDPADVADLVALFAADWAGTDPEPDLACTRMLVSPINARERLLDLIESAQTSLDIESMQFADSEIRAAVAARVEAGVTVRALLADASWIDANADAAAFLQALAVPVRWIPHLHTKVLIVDGERAYAGSENFSYTSLEKNREVGVVMVEPQSIAPLTATFEADWAIGTPF